MNYGAVAAIMIVLNAETQEEIEEEIFLDDSITGIFLDDTVSPLFVDGAPF